MNNLAFKIGFVITAAAFVVLNVFDYLYERQEYFAMLEETGMVWGGAWSWGFPLTMMIEGSDFDKHSMIEPIGASLNLIICLASAGVAGVICEYLWGKLRSD